MKWCGQKDGSVGSVKASTKQVEQADAELHGQEVEYNDFEGKWENSDFTLSLFTAVEEHCCLCETSGVSCWWV